MFESRPRPALILLVWILLELLAAAQARHDGRSVLGGWLHAASQPVTTTAGAAVNLGRDLAWGLGNLHTLLARVHDLQSALERAEAERALLREDVAALREADHLAHQLPLLSTSPRLARCLYRNLPAGTMEVSAGMAEGVRRDTAVVAAGGLVGRVTWVGSGTCRVELITSPAAGVAVRIGEGAVPGIAVGVGDGTLAVRYVPRRAQVLRGADLVTSGEDGVYPPGIPVGRVATVRESGGQFLAVVAVPTADLARLRVVLVLAGWPHAGRAPGPS